MEYWKFPFLVVVAILVSITFAAIYAHQSGGQVEWGKQWGTMGMEDAGDIGVDGQGNIYISGETEGNLFGQNQGKRCDIFFAKLDGSGQVLWSKQLGTPEDDDDVFIAVDGEGGVYAATTTLGEWFGQNLGERDIVLLRFSPDGQLLWGKRLGTSKDDVATSIAIDNQNNAYISIWTMGRLFGKLDNRDYEYKGAIIKINLKGDILWRKHLDDNLPDVITVDSQGNIYIGGLFYDKTINIIHTFIAKLASDGTIIWRQIEQNTEDETILINTLKVDREGNLCVAGGINVYADENKLVGIPDAFIAKYNGTNGQRVWLKRFKSQEENIKKEEFFDIFMDREGYIYVVGIAEGSLFGKLIGDTDVVIAKIDSAGNVIWGKQWGTDKGEKGVGIVINDQGNLYVVGETNGNVFSMNAGKVDVFVVKFKQ